MIISILADAYHIYSYYFASTFQHIVIYFFQGGVDCTLGICIIDIDREQSLVHKCFLVTVENCFAAGL